MIRRAERTDFPFVYRILQQIFDEMQMATIAALPADQFYDLMKFGFLSADYRYSYRRIWVNVDQNDAVLGILCMYPDKDQKIIDFALRQEYAKARLPLSTVIFSEQEAWPGEWYLDSIAVRPDHWGQGIASQLIDFANDYGHKQGYHCISLNVDQENPRAQHLYVHKGFKTVRTMTIGSRSYDHMIKKV